MKLINKVCMVTGGAQGIGKAIASAFAGEGAHVVLCDINLEKAERVAENLRASTKRRVLALYADVSKKEDVEKVVKETLKEFGRIDILVNNAGVWRDSLLVDMSVEDWEIVFAVNVKGVFLCAQAAAREMVKQRSGRIINVASVAGKGAGSETWGAYCASKAAVIMLTRVLALELKPYGIEVNALCPGATETDMLKTIISTQGGNYAHAAKPEDVAEAVVLVASEEAKGLTGKDFDGPPWASLESVRKRVKEYRSMAEKTLI